jgi:hypothetical protein
MFCNQEQSIYNSGLDNNPNEIDIIYLYNSLFLCCSQVQPLIHQNLPIFIHKAGCASNDRVDVLLRHPIRQAPSTERAPL